MNILSVIPLIVFLASSPTGTPEEPPAKTEYKEEVKVSLVQLNILATDRKGNPVTDLKAEEIEIMDGGEAQEIAFLQPYYKPRGTSGTEVSGGHAGPKAPATAATAVTPGRWIVLFFDNYTTSPRTRIKAIEAARSFVESRVREGDQVAVVSFSGKIDLLHAFTGDRDVLMQACDRALAHTDHAAGDPEGDLENLMNSVETCRNSNMTEACAERFAESYEDERIRDAQAFLTALILFIRSLAPIPDIKTLVLFSEGVPREPAAEAAEAVSAVLGLRMMAGMNVGVNRSLDESYDRLAEAAAVSKVTIFPINAGGANRRTDAAVRRQAPAQVDLTRSIASNNQQGLVELARRTGGTAVQTTNVLNALRGVVDLSPGLYTVGYYPTDRVPSSRFREVRIRVLRKGIEVQTRREVPAPAEAPPLTGDLSVTPRECSERNRRPLVLKLRLDRRKLLFEKVEKRFSSNFSVYIRLLAEDQSEPIHQDYRFFNITNTPEEMAAGTLPDPTFEQTLIVPCQPLTVAVTVSDAASGASAEFISAVGP